MPAPLLDLEGAEEVKVGYRDALAIMSGNRLLWEKPDGGPDLTLEMALGFEEAYGERSVLDYSGKRRDVFLALADQRTESFANNGTHAAKRGAVVAGATSGVDVAPFNAMASRTVMGWVSYYTLTGTWLMRWQNQALNSGVFGLYLTNGNTLNARVKKGGVNYQASFGVSPAVNSWYHVAQTYDAVTGDIKIYVGGVLRATFNVPGGGAPDAADFIDLAGDGQGPNEDTASGAAVDDFRIYSRALTSDEVLTDMSSPAGPLTVPTLPVPQYEVGWAEGSGATTVNLGGRGGTIDPVTPGATNWGPGETGGGSGKSQWRVGNQATGTPTWTFMTHYRLTEALPVNGHADIFGSQALYGYDLWQAVAGEGGMALEATGGTGGAAAFLMPHFISTDGWQHITLASNGTTTKVYVDGVLFNTFVAKGPSLSGVLLFGDDGTPLELDNTKVFGTELTPEQIAYAARLRVG